MPLPEKALIASIRQVTKTAGPGRGQDRAIRVGIGDDCAVLQFAPRKDTLVTTDFTLEGVHFRRDWHPPESVGHRCLVRGLSDIAAMGGEPVAAFLSLALPSDLPQSWVRRFTRSLISLAKRYDVTLAGGDTAESPTGILADIIVVGAVPKGEAMLRSGARPGNRIFVTGELGGSAAALGLLRAKPGRRLNPNDYPRHFYPEPRVALGRVLREKGLATAAIDLSDGLSTDLSHICEESGVGAEVEAERIPVARVGKPTNPHRVDLDLALHGGEDYELLFTAPAGRRMPSRIAGVGLTCIGSITRRRKIILRDAADMRSELVPSGWEHFRRGA